MSASISEILVLCVCSEQRQATDAETDMVAWREMKGRFCCAPYTFYYYRYMIIEVCNLLIPGLCSSPGRPRPSRYLFGVLKPDLCSLSPACVCSPGAPVSGSEPLLSPLASSCSRFGGSSHVSRNLRRHAHETQNPPNSRLHCLCVVICRFLAGCSSERQRWNRTKTKIRTGLCFGSVHHFLNHCLISVQFRQGAGGSWLVVSFFFFFLLLDENTHSA